MSDPLAILHTVLTAARASDYSGYSKFDALNSPLLETLSFNRPWLRLLYTQLVKMAPVNLRPLVGVVPSRNPKGIALFARALLDLFAATGADVHRREAESLLDWLLANPSPGRPRLCWGYNFVWQNTIFLQARFEPNAVVTVFVGEALIHAFRVTGRSDYLEAAVAVADFIVNDLPVVVDTAEERAVAYVLRPVDAVVLNNQVLTGAFLAKVHRHTGSAVYLDCAVRQLTYTVARRTAYGCWYYTEPRRKSPITHDNYHTGGILDGLLEFAEETGDPRFNGVYRQGLAYYRDHLFESDGAPRWMHDRRYPCDVHGAAQGIITFTKAARYDPSWSAPARRTLDWTLKHLYRPARGEFIYRKGRWITYNYTLMRWCNAWMARALGELCRPAP